VGHAPDGVIEAIEVQGAVAVGVQWHPEFLREPDPIFDWLLAVARDGWSDRSMTKEHCDAATG
jgi:putative glutamine amidotransferase